MAESERAASSGFPPILGSGARVLILGSLPGQKSLDAQQYYAHPQNAFWKIIGVIADIDPSTAYDERCAALLDRRMALWDVLASSVRPGSLDTAIDIASARSNDFVSLLELHTEIEFVGFNGKKARQLYDRFVAERVSEIRELTLMTLPSTSPANAAMTFEEKLDLWSVIGEYLKLPPTGSEP